MKCIQKKQIDLAQLRNLLSILANIELRIRRDPKYECKNALVIFLYYAILNKFYFAIAA